MMKAILFDIDDTLYDQRMPFDAAYREMFGDADEAYLAQLFQKSRQWNEKTFEATERGEIPLEQLHIDRLKYPMADFGIDITDGQALEFQKRYRANGKKIYVSDVMQQILTYCGKYVITGIVTNGPVRRQQSKIKVLHLTEWIDSEKIFISGDIGYMKPDRRIFDYAAEKLELLELPESILYVGDSWTNDVMGAQNAGWSVIWFNRRNHKKPDEYRERIMEVHTEEELFCQIKKEIQK